MAKIDRLHEENSLNEYTWALVGCSVLLLYGFKSDIILGFIQSWT